MSHVSRRTKMALGALALAGLVAGATHSVMAAGSITYATGKVGAITVTPLGDFFFHLENKPPLCASTPDGTGKDFVVVSSSYVSSDGKKALLSAITSAKLAGRAIQVRGVNNGTVNEWGCHLDAVDVY